MYKINEIKEEVGRVIIGKEDIINKVLMTILAKGHVLLDDIPGVGKTTLALAFSKTMGLDFRRLQFTPDVVPSDIVGFSMYIKEKGEFEYRPGAAMCNFFLADEINRTSSKTQSALLEVMQEGKITIDGETREIPKPFVVVATQNPLGTIGTQSLPEAQMDRFMIRISMGYPDSEAHVRLLKDRHHKDPLAEINRKITGDEVIAMQNAVDQVYFDDKLYRYVTALAEATREHEMIKLGLSPRGAIAICAMAKSSAFTNGRDFAIPDDVENVFVDVSNHRMVMEPKSRIEEKTASDFLTQILSDVKKPRID